MTFKLPVNINRNRAIAFAFLVLICAVFGIYMTARYMSNKKGTVHILDTKNDDEKFVIQKLDKADEVDNSERVDDSEMLVDSRGSDNETGTKPNTLDTTDAEISDLEESLKKIDEDIKEIDSTADWNL